MRRAVLITAVAVSLSLSVLHAADDLVLTRFGDYLESLRVQAGIPGLAAIVVGPAEVQWERGFGQQNIERSIFATPMTPFHLDGLGQVLTASKVLRCAEEGRLLLDDRIGTFAPDAADPNATLRQLLSHTSGGSENLVFSYRPERLEPLASAIAACSGDSYRHTIAELLDQLIMQDSVPGPDVLQFAPPTFGITPPMIERYRNVLSRLATPYAVDPQGRASPSRYAATTLTAASGLISTARDLAQFDLALKKGVLLRAETIAEAWTPPLNRLGQRLPHGLGWFVQSYGGEPVVWQFGVGENASSSLVATLPRRGLTLILLANSDGLARSFALGAGDLTVSPFGRLFLGIFVR